MLRHRFLTSCILCLCLLTVGVFAAAQRRQVTVPEDILGTAPDQYGAAVAMSDTYAVVGRPKDRIRGFQVGAAYIYERQGNTWVAKAILRPDGKPAHDFFGSAVAISGEVAVVGAPGTSQERGAAYIFERRHGVWTQVRKLRASPAYGKDAFGQAVAIAGGYVLVGAPGDEEARQHAGDHETRQNTDDDNDDDDDDDDDDDNDDDDDDDDGAGQHAGAVYVFARQQGVWHPQAVQKILASDVATHAGFGATVAMSGTYAVIGAPQHDHGFRMARDYGAAYVLELRQGVWRETAQLQASHSAPRDHFGSTVAISGQEVVVGAPWHKGSGAAFLFTRQGNAWIATESATLLGSQSQRGDRFGAAVALSGTALLVGAYADDARNHRQEPLKNRQGSVALFERQATGWTEVTRFTGSRTQLHAHFGYAIALMGEHALVGAPALLGGPDGQVYAYNGLHPNAAPAIRSTPNTTATVGRLYRYQVEATDADNDPLLYAFTRAPTGMAIDGTHGLITWTPAAAGAVDVEITVQDDRGGMATQAYTLTVQAPNQPPYITSAPVTSTEIMHVIPRVEISDAHLVRQTITLNGQPYTPGTSISTPGDYMLTVEAMDAAGNTTLKTVRFTLTRPGTP